MSGPGTKFQRKQGQAIVALMSCTSTEAAARKAGVGESTLRAWLTKPDFLAALRGAQREIYQQSMTQLVRVTGKAVAALEQILDDKEAPPAVRVSAAKAVLDLAAKASDDDLEARVEALERGPDYELEVSLRSVHNAK